MSSTSMPVITMTMEAGLAVVTLANGARGNPINDAFVGDFRRTVDALHRQAGLRAVLLRAEGANFCYGGDLKSFQVERGALGPLVRRWTTELHEGLEAFWRLPVPTVSAVQGYAMGGGASLAAGADVVVAGASAKIGAAFTQIGFSCDSGTSVTLTARMGPARAKRFVLLSEVLGAEDARSAGLFDMVVPDAGLAETAHALARRLADGPTVAYSEVKRLFHRTWAAMAKEQLEDESMTLARVVDSADADEGVQALLQKRTPKFTGR